MKIRITQGQRDFAVRIPNALALNGITSRIACAAARKYAPEVGERLSPDAIERIFTELNRIRKKHGSWVLVEVEEAAGERIQISL